MKNRKDNASDNSEPHPWARRLRVGKFSKVAWALHVIILRNYKYNYKYKHNYTQVQIQRQLQHVDNPAVI